MRASKRLTALCDYVQGLYAVKLTTALRISTGLGKRKRVMDEKELMIPLELGYVQRTQRNKASQKKNFTSGGVQLLSLIPAFASVLNAGMCTCLHTLTHIHT